MSFESLMTKCQTLKSSMEALAAIGATGIRVDIRISRPRLALVCPKPASELYAGYEGFYDRLANAAALRRRATSSSQPATSIDSSRRLQSRLDFLVWSVSPGQTAFLMTTWIPLPD